MILRDQCELLEKTSTPTRGYSNSSYNSYATPKTLKCEYMTLGGKVSAKDYGITDATVQSMIFMKPQQGISEKDHIKVTATKQGISAKEFEVYLLKPFKSHDEVFLKPVG